MKKQFSSRDVVLSTTLGFSVLAPLVTFGLLWLKGLPAFAAGYTGHVVLWLYTSTGLQSVLAGGMLAGILRLAQPRWGFFIWPFDLGRSLSFGGIAGAAVYSLSTLLVRVLSHRPHSDFWIAGALIAGCLTGALVSALVFWWLSKNPIVS